ncbi:MAG: hypothetical protein P8Y01_00600 [Woeseiaceae bacterium]|jgi:hypothetical protein
MTESGRPKTLYAFEPDYHGFKPPEDPAIPLWRYMDFVKFVSLLEANALYFARTDLLGDAWEGSLTRSEAEKRKALEAEMRVRMLHGTTFEKIRSEVTNSIASCWHANHNESMAMWRLYLASPEGVAVKSSYERLTDSFPRYDGKDKGRNEDNTEKELRIHVGMVSYVDYEAPTPPAGPRFLLKRRSFEHEREIRAVATDTTWGSSPTFDDRGIPLTRFESGGDYVPVDLETLIEAVYISPEAQAWFVDLVKSMVERFGLTCPVRQSDLARDPVF